MSIISGIKRQLRSVIQWQDDGLNLLEQWTDNGDEIKNASQLIVGPGQGCIFVYRGKLEAMIHDEGVYPLKTANIPFITTLLKVMQSFESEHKVGIYFFRKALVLDQKWGTRSPIKYQDPVYDFPVGLKVYGNFSYRLRNPKYFFKTILGSRPSYSLQEMQQVITDRMLHSLSDYLAESRYSYTDIDSQRIEIAAQFQQRFDKELNDLGLSISDFRIEGSDFDNDTNKRIARIADITAESLAATKAGLSYVELQQIEALRDAAKNENGAAGAGVGIGAGIGLGQKMADTFDTSTKNDLTQQFIKLKQLYEMEVITEQEYQAKKQALLDKI